MSTWNCGDHTVQFGQYIGLLNDGKVTKLPGYGDL